jgi:hypothetical protein
MRRILVFRVYLTFEPRQCCDDGLCKHELNGMGEKNVFHKSRYIDREMGALHDLNVKDGVNCFCTHRV